MHRDVFQSLKPAVERGFVDILPGAVAVDVGEEIGEFLPHFRKIYRMRELKERCLVVVEHLPQAVGAGAGEDGLDARFVHVQAGAQRADERRGAVNARQFLNFVQEQ